MTAAGRNRIKWLLTSVCVLLLIACIVSTVWYGMVGYGNFGFNLNSCTLGIWHFPYSLTLPHTLTPRLFWAFHPDPFDRLRDIRNWAPSWGRQTGLCDWCLDIPMHTLLLVLAIPTTLLWWRSLRHQPGTCAKCGYDLRASQERCPECSTAIQNGMRPSVRRLSRRRATEVR